MLKIGGEKIQKDRKLLIVLCIISLLFLILYYKFIFEDYAYVFSIPDIGNDTFFVYYPSLAKLSEFIHGGSFDLYSLSNGLGGETITILSTYGNPVDLIAALFPVETLHIGILVSTYLKILIIGIFSFKFFGMVVKSPKGIISSTIAWTFCSYIVIWGQHYSFCTQMMNFTIFMYFLQKWLLGSKSTPYIWIPFMSFFLINSFYIFYISGIFSAVYTIFYLLFMEKKAKLIFSYLLKLLFFAVASICLGAIFFLPVMVVFSDSTRSSGLINYNSILDIFKIYDLKTIVSDVSRLYNPDLLGSAFGEPWSGTLNYYESALISCSILSVYSISYQLLYANKKTLKKIIFMIAIIILIFPIFTFLFTFNISARRWTYILIFISCLCIGGLFDAIAEKKHKEIMKASIIGLCINILVFSVLFIVHKIGIINISKGPFIITVIFSFVYFFVLSINLKEKKLRELILIIVLIFEMGIVNYNPINNRGVEKSGAFLSHYLDGTKEAVEFLSEYDTSLYRVSPIYQSVFLNDAYIQEFKGFNSYSSFNSKEFWKIAQTFGGEFNGFSNYVKFDDLVFQNILGSKYILSKVPLSEYQLVKKISNIYIYKQQYEIPFGFLYKERLNDEAFKTLDLSERIKNLSKGYVTENNENTTIEKAKMMTSVMDIGEAITQYINCEKNNDNYIVASNEDPQIILSLDLKQDLEAIKIDIELNAEKDAVLQLFYGDEKGFIEDQSMAVEIKAGENKIEINLPKSIDLKYLRLDPSNVKQNIKLEKMDLIYLQNTEIKSYVQEIKENGVQNAKYENSTFSGEIINNESKPNMLFIPITYSPNLVATIDDEPADVYSINSGFTGLMIPKGRHDISITYRIRNINIAFIVSLASIILYLISLYIFLSNKRKKQK